jgi:single-strand DNA-binding protein
VQGRLKARSFETREGEKRTVFEIDVDEVGPSLRSATAKVTRASRSGAEGGSSAGGVSQGGSDPWATPAPAAGAHAGQPANDPWASPSASSSDEPPF